MNKKSNPRSTYIIIRVSPQEKKEITLEALGNVSEYIRSKLGL